MNFQVTPFPLAGKVALFCPRTDDIWRIQSAQCDEQAFFQREVISVMSTDSGHFLLVLQGDELTTVREVCRTENCEFAGIYDRNEVPAAISQQLTRIRPPNTKKSLFC